TGLATANERGEQVDDLDARLEHFSLAGKLRKRRRLTVNGPKFLGVHWPATVDWLAEQVEYAAKRFLADGNLDGLAGVQHVHAAHQPVRRSECNRTDSIPAQVLLNFAGQVDFHALVITVNLERVIDFRQMPFLKFGVKRRADDLHNLSGSGA